MIAMITMTRVWLWATVIFVGVSITKQSSDSDDGNNTIVAAAVVAADAYHQRSRLDGNISQLSSILSRQSQELNHHYQQHQQQHDEHSRHRQLMVNGVNAQPHEFPFYVTVGCCSGALIAPDVVLSASHDVPSDPTGMTVTTGSYYTNNNVPSPPSTTGINDDLDGNNGNNIVGEDRTIIESYRHPLSDNMHHDFTILILDQPVRTSTIRPIKINRSSNFPIDHQLVTLLGTGTTNLTGTDRPNVLQKATTRYIPNDECSQSFDETRGIRYDGSFLDDTNLCTHGITDIDNGDGCVFDSGGPVIAVKSATTTTTTPTTTTTSGDNYENDNNNDEQIDRKDPYVLIGLISFGVDCADPVYPAVNARVSAVSDWIDMVVCDHSIAPPQDFPCSTKKNQSSSSSTTTTTTTEMPSPSSLSSSIKNKVFPPTHLSAVTTVFWMVALVAVVVSAAMVLTIVSKRNKPTNVMRSRNTTSSCVSSSTSDYYYTSGERQPLL